MSLVGKWDFEKAENLEDYMKATNVPENLREVAMKSQPTMIIENSGEQWTIKTTVGDKIKDTTFTLGQEFNTVSLTGQPLKCLVKGDGNRMTETQKAEGQTEVVITREISDGKLVSKMTYEGVTATVTFQKQ